MMAVSLQHLPTVVGTGIVQQQYLKIPPGLLQQAIHAALQKSTVVVIGYYDSEKGQAVCFCGPDPDSYRDVEGLKARLKNESAWFDKLTMTGSLRQLVEALSLSKGG
jgi:threonine dehydrogenase-like Zn-dependent dehydrogenase